VPNIKELRAGDFGQKLAKPGVSLQVLILKSLLLEKPYTERKTPADCWRYGENSQF